MPRAGRTHLLVPRPKGVVGPSLTAWAGVADSAGVAIDGLFHQLWVEHEQLRAGTADQQSI